jgi:phosphate-selective porin OprO/OprP
LIQNFLFDRGVMAFGSPTKGLYYGASLTNGTGQNIDERQSNGTETTQDGKDFTARLAFNLAQAGDWRDWIVQVGGSYKRGTQANSVSSPYSAASIITEGRGVTFFTPQAFNPSSGPAQVGEIDRRLWGLEGILSRGPVKLQAEYIAARYSGERIAAPTGGFDRDISGYYVSAMWLLTGESYADAYRDSFVARVRPRNNFSWKDGTWGAWELGLRYSAIDASDFSTGNPAFTGRPNNSSTALVQTNATQAKAYTVGIKWLPNAYVRFLLDYIRTEFDGGIVVDGERIGHEDAINFRAQFDFF